MPWDAEIVLRSFYEASARILFLALADPNERETLDREFRETLVAVADRRRALKVHVSKSTARETPKSAAILDALRDPKMFAVEPRGGKSHRKALEQKWSFSEIIASLSRLEREDIRGLPELAAYLHSYGLASHLLHADCTALDLIHDRAIRPPVEEALLSSAQLCRIFTDVVGLQCYCAEAVRALLGRDFKDRERLYSLVWQCFELSSPILEAFYDTQADFYGRHGRSEFSDGVRPETRDT